MIHRIVPCQVEYRFRALFQAVPCKVIARPRTRWVQALSLLVSSFGVLLFVELALAQTDLQPPAGQVIQHCDLFEDAPRLIQGQHHPHRAQSQTLGAMCDGSDQQIVDVVANEPGRVRRLRGEEAVERDRLFAQLGNP